MADPDVRVADAVLARARELADTLLFPAALDVDRTDTIPPGHLDRLAEHGFYGLAGPDQPAVLNRVVETLAGGCLATTFVWLQHHGAVRAVAASDRPAVRQHWLGPLCRGERRAGVVQAALRPGPPSVRADRVPGGYVFDGEAPWVSGWGMLDTLHTAARDERDTVIWALIDAGPPITATAQELVAVNASRTVAVRFDRLFVPDERVISTAPHRPVSDPDSLRLNGALALGVAGRCLALLDADTADLNTAELDACRAALEHGDDVPAARANAAELALRAAARLVVARGARSVLRDDHAQRLAREAVFLLVFGTRAPIQRALLDRLGHARR